MIVDLHNHTPLCNHAKGSPREFIEKAIEKKINLFGFSDHAPMKFDEGYRMTFEQMDGYEREIAELKDEYKDTLDLLFLKHTIELEFSKHSFGFSNKAGKGKIQEIEIAVPINKNGTFNLDLQKQIADKFEKIEVIKKSILSELDRISKTEIDFE